ncbi:histidine phosphatase family protein [Aliiroseovarius sp. Z3]|uniref:histidine phosphatase family protein n=1 Tax=Aliiroseovarius sp. Z3 TaxID=2811402 RepID=UPI0023B31617|nr:histidine phosphatase family protein [Aliiroseovarius sp. Z3]MDE9451887.1 histidine phosphatase family protein [Aliiroseovarius sp. Z3]MDE9452045.1 histidine phosphatase family protein [Aliiroseovarius sp. Z3]
MRLLLVRHGQSEWNAERRLQGQADIGLSELGKAQANALRPVIEDIAPCRTIASDLKRVRETATRIGAEAPRFTRGLREIDVGDWSGRSIDELLSEDEAAYQGWRAGTIAPPGGEAWDDFAARVTGVVEAEQLRDCRNLLIVCHGGVIRALLQRFIGLQPAHIIPVAPASLTALRLGNGRPARLELFNYLPDGLEFGAPD